MKQYYEEAELEIIQLQEIDIITESIPDDNETPGINPF